jgi:hypothetical protein
LPADAPVLLSPAFGSLVRGSALGTSRTPFFDAEAGFGLARSKRLRHLLLPPGAREKHMSICRKQEKAALSHDEWTFVTSTHHPDLGNLPAQELSAARTRLREMHARERGFTAHKGRVARGTAEPRGGSFPGTVERPRFRKQIFAQALRRVNSEVERRAAAETWEMAVAAQKAVLEAKRAAPATRPANRPTAGGGKAPKPSTRGPAHISGSRVGSTSAAGKRAQARRDG